MKQRKPIRRVSNKRAKENREYAKVKAAWLPLHPTCEIGPKLARAGINVRCRKVTTHPHHIRGRIGTMLCDTRYWLASCAGECHPHFIHNYPHTARRLGLLQ